MERLLYAVYRVFTLTQAGRILLGKTEFEVNRYLPFDDYGTGARTVMIFFRNLGKSALLFFFSMTVLARNDFKYIAINIVASICYYYHELISWKRNQEMKILKQLSAFIGELRHSYYRVGDVEEAFSEAFHLSGEELKLHLGLIEEAFEYGGIPERYKVAVPSKFLLVLLSICQCTIKYGDKDMIFISNLDELQKNIDSDLLKWDRENFLLGSLFLVIVSPILFLPLMERWAVSQMVELSFLYHEYMGSLIRITVILLSFPVFLFFLEMKNTNHQSVNPFISYLLEISVINKFFKTILGREDGKKSKTARIFERYFPQISYVNFVLFRVLCFWGSQIFVVSWIFYWEFSNFYLLLSPVLAYCFSFYPYFVLAIKGLYYESELEDEISQVRIMMISLSNVAGMNAYEILLWVESFTTYLKESISECIDEFGSDEETALLGLRKKWGKTSFMSIVDDLIASDKIGIREAFKDLLSRREYHIARRRQEQEFITRKKEAILNTFMYFPFMAAVFLYLIIPFLYISLNNLLEITMSLRSMRPRL